MELRKRNKYMLYHKLMDEQREGSGANGNFCFQSFFQYVPLIFAEKNSSIRNKPISNEYQKTLIICLTDTMIGNL